MGFRICCQTMADALYSGIYQASVTDDLTRPLLVCNSEGVVDQCPFCGQEIIETVVD